MELSEAELQEIQDANEILELQSQPAFQKFLARMANAVMRIEQSLGTVKCKDWDAYLSLWYRRETLLRTLGELDTLQKRRDELNKKAATEPDDSPATGSLA